MSQIQNSPGVQAAGGNFVLTGTDGKQTTLCFASLMIELGVRNLTANQQAFETQMARSQSLVDAMQELNEIMQAAGLIKAKFSSESKAESVHGGQAVADLYTKLEAFNRNYPDFKVEANIVTSSITNLIGINKGDTETLISNLQTSQSLLSSFNEQQGTRTSQAMSRSTGFLQQLQTAMQTAKEALLAAAKTGGM
ncbi:MAG: hypothetical protein LBO77_06370 [Desulfovibrio sp.]|jgi:hypothetical protein|nr:hypothetical protein [Desulfovibrio sp.]